MPTRRTQSHIMLADENNPSTSPNSSDTPIRKRNSSPRRPGSLPDIDFQLSKRLAICGTHAQQLPLHLSVLRYFCRFLEYTGHGVPWFIVSIWKIAIAVRPDHIEFWSNMILALSVDLWAVAILKAIVRRPRPVYAPQVATLAYSPDKFSFPSGHTSRAVMEAILWCSLGLPDFFTKVLMVIWAASVCLSRIILGRHYISDVCAGIILGIFLAWLQLKVIWMGLPLCRWLLEPIHHTISM